MFEGLRQDIGYLAGEARRGVSDLMGQVRAAIPRPDVNLYEQRPGETTVEFSLGSRRWNFDVSGRAAYVLGDARSLFRRVTGVNAPPVRVRPRVPASLERCFDPTQERNAPAIAAQMASSDPVVRGSGETAFRELVRHHPQAAAQAVDQQRQACAAQGDTSSVARLDHSVQTSAHAVLAQPATSRSLIATSRSCVVSFTASLQPSPLKNQMLRIACVPQNQNTPSTTPTALTMDSFRTYVRGTSSIGSYPGVFMACVSPEIAETYGPYSRAFTRTDSPEALTTQPFTPTILGTLPIQPSTPTPLDGAHTITPDTTPAFTPNVPVVAIRRPDGQIVYVPALPTTPFTPNAAHTAPSTLVATTTPSTTLFAETNAVVGTDPSVTFISGADRTSVPSTAVTFVAANDNGGSIINTHNRPNEPTRRVADAGVTTRPRHSHPAHSSGPMFAGLFAEAPANNDGPHFVSPAQAGYVVPEGQPAFIDAHGAPLPRSLGGANPSIARRGEPHDGQGQGGGYSGGDNGEGEGRDGQGNPNDRRRQPEEAQAEAAA